MAVTPPVLFERDAELQVIADLMHRAKHGAGAMVLVEASAGLNVGTDSVRFPGSPIVLTRGEPTVKRAGLSRRRMRVRFLISWD